MQQRSCRLATSVLRSEPQRLPIRVPGAKSIAQLVIRRQRIAAARLTRRRFDAEPGVHIKLDKRGDGVAPVEGDTVQVNYSGRVKVSACVDINLGRAVSNRHRQARR